MRYSRISLSGSVLFWPLAILLAFVTLGCGGDQPSSSGTNGAPTQGPDEKASTSSAGSATPETESSSTNSDEVSIDQTSSETSHGTGHEAAHDTAHVNRLASETSPYLRLHMHNPVDWYPWSEEAFARAKEEDKPIFLSVGYSSCYWCHVMERESFMDDEIAAFLNEHFVCIKVDREERPDVDDIYMLAVQLMTQRGGWPMSVFMTPDGKPFFGGTYFPARDNDRPGSPGFLTVINRLHELWRDQRETLTKQANLLTDAIQSEMRGPEVDSSTPIDATIRSQVKSSLAAVFDDQYGGFGYSSQDPQRPKFPEPSNLMFLADCVAKTHDEDCLRMLTVTLDRMAMGGIWDHVGGGFHRYSVDRYWQIPHFEKMLYDNGQLISVYSQAYQLTDNPLYARIVERTVSWLNREMRHEGGAYYSALDAESEQVEGKYYRWLKEEVERILGGGFERYAQVYGLNESPNFEGEFYVIQRRLPLAKLAEEQGVDANSLLDAMMAEHAKLLAVRDQRPRPLTDSKILCSWNGQIIRGLADAGRYLENSEFIADATQAANFVLRELRTEEGRLLRTYSDGAAKLNAYLDDYAFLINGLIALHRATGDVRWLNEANTLMQKQIELYWDEQNGGFFFTTEDHESLIARSKQLADGAQPAGNSVAVENLIYLSEQLARPAYRERAEQTQRNAIIVMKKFPRLAPRMAATLP